VSKLIFPCFTVVAVTLRDGRRNFCDRASVRQWKLAAAVMCARTIPRESPPLNRGAFLFRKKPRSKRAAASASASVSASELVKSNQFRGWRERLPGALRPTTQRWLRCALTIWVVLRLL